MLIKAIFAGFGGQGVLSMGRNIVQAAMMEGKYVTYLPAYGVEVRGGTANCTVAVSDEQIASPVASSPEYIVVMNQPSLLKFQNQLESGGVLFVNSSLINSDILRGDIEVAKVAANEIAEKLGSARAANMIMLGAFVKKTNLVSIDTVSQTLGLALKGKTASVNQKALMAGYELF